MSTGHRSAVASLLMSGEYIAPKQGEGKFHCPNCHVLAHQRWGDVQLHIANVRSGTMQPLMTSSDCAHCGVTAVWVGESLIYPSALLAPPAHDDLAEPARTTYNEARAALPASARASAALLRLCLEQVVEALGATTGNLNDRIGELVAVGLPPPIQQAMDSLRLIGNDAIHAGQIDASDDPATALRLFGLVNLVVETMVTQPRLIAELYNGLPSTKLDQITQRDSTS